MLDQWLFLALLLPLGFIMPAVPIGLSRLIGPRKSNPIKDSAYECGVETVGDTWIQFKVQYYIFALVFVVFDVEAVFLFPWAVAYRSAAAVHGAGRSALHRRSWRPAWSTPGARATSSGFDRPANESMADATERTSAISL